MPQRMLPEPTPETRHLWDGCREGELRLQRCAHCGG
ncbi:MAG: DNA-binding protein, partial [Alphaproteobacteria bacterium]|nr:DNA-binding protein [Alphaproteobacteria bacterium]